MPTRKFPKKSVKQALVSRELTHSADGVDLTLIRWLLSLTPAERLDVLQNHVRSILKLRGEESEA